MLPTRNQCLYHLGPVVTLGQTRICFRFAFSRRPELQMSGVPGATLTTVAFFPLACIRGGPRKL